jgi:discoidin domain receptor family protein 2
MSYSMPQGERWDNSLQLFDWTYDGKDDGGFLSGGVGQLVDGKLGQEKLATLKGPKSCKKSIIACSFS